MRRTPRTSRVVSALLTFRPVVCVVTLLLGGTASSHARAADAEACTIPDEWLDSLQWRNIGPANMGGRITDLAVNPNDRCMWWASTASGGLLKTINNGVTFEHQFTHESTVSIGDVTVAPSNPDVVWVGTGESNPRNSVSWGDGVYKSVDGGATWKNMGLEESYQIGRIAIHPENPDIVYVGALGRLWGPNEQRGLFKTTDGGETWEKVLYINDMTGVIDVQMHPTDPDTLLVATYERERDGFDTNDPAKKWGEGSGLWRTTDGGKTFTELTEGLPTGLLGRIGIDYYRANPAVIYAIVESDRIGQEPENAAHMGVDGENAEVGARLTEVTEDGPAAAAELRVGDIVLSLGGVYVHSWADLQTEIRKHLADETVAVVVSRDRKTVEVEVTFTKRPGAEEDEESAEEQDERPGRQARQRSPFGGRLGGQVQNVQDQQGDDGFEYGGVYRSADGGDTWTRVNSVNPRPMYFSQIRVDPSDENHLYVLGVSLYRSSDGGKTFTPDGHDQSVHVDHHAMWIDPSDGRHIILGNDGGVYITWDRMKRWDHYNHAAIGQFYHVTVGSRPNYFVYGGLQDNGSWGGPSRVRTGDGTLNEDWFRVGSGDGFVCRVDPDDPDLVYFESQNGGMGRYNIATNERRSLRPRPQRGQRYRFNWRTPFILSDHNPGIYYVAGNHVFRSYTKGENLRKISPEITNGERGSATALAESSRNPDILFVGSDDGALWRTLDGGHTWHNLFDLPEETAEEASEAEPAEEAPTAGAEAAEQPRERGQGEGRRGGRGGRMLQQLMERDANGDGRIQKSEVPATMHRMFDRLDGNDDGTIDQAEIEAMQSRAGARGQGRPADRPRPAAPSAASDPDDAVSGTWQGSFEMEDFPPDDRRITLTLKLGEENKVTGAMDTSQGEREIANGTFDPESGKLTFDAVADEMTLNIIAQVKGETVQGEIKVGGMGFSLPFSAERQARAAVAEAADDGYDWKPIDELVPGPRWVSEIAVSRHEDDRVYLTLDGHRSNDDAPYVFVSENNGTTWRSLAQSLPEGCGSTRCVAEDLTRPDVLYLGTEFGMFVSLDRGTSWTKLRGDFPTVAVHAIAQHAGSNDVVVGTHGRSIWILDATPLRQINHETMTASAQLFAPSDTSYWLSRPSRGGDIRRFVGGNPAESASIFYTVGNGTRSVKLHVEDAGGNLVRELTSSADQGLHRATWDLRRAAPENGERQSRFRRRGVRVEPGKYRIVLTANGNEQVQTMTITGDPEYPRAVLWGEEYEEQLELEELFNGDVEEGADGR